MGGGGGEGGGVGVNQGWIQENRVVEWGVGGGGEGGGGWESTRGGSRKIE